MKTIALQGILAGQIHVDCELPDERSVLGSPWS